MKNEAREFRLDEISVLCIIRDLLKNIWVILLAAAAAMVCGDGVMSFRYVPEYTAQATMAVSARGAAAPFLSLPDQPDGGSIQRSLRQQCLKRKDCQGSR